MCGLKGVHVAGSYIRPTIPASRVAWITCRTKSRAIYLIGGWAMLVGIILFSGFLFAWLATGRKFFVYPVPVGGISFIIGWLMLAFGALGFWGKN